MLRCVKKVSDIASGELPGGSLMQKAHPRHSGAGRALNFGMEDLPGAVVLRRPFVLTPGDFVALLRLL